MVTIKATMMTQLENSRIQSHFTKLRNICRRPCGQTLDALVFEACSLFELHLFDPEDGCRTSGGDDRLADIWQKG